MSITVTILEGPLPTRHTVPAAGAGAVICFEGIVRGMENQRAIAALTYETYDPMARHMLEQLAGRLRDTFALLAIHVEHSRGRVPVGACAFRLEVAALHRREALAALAEFIDTMKQDVPIWKRPVYPTVPEESAP